jgi:hypothetical protein
MRWLPWILGIGGVLQYAVIVAIQPSDYVSLDMAYLVMWLAIIGGVLTCYLSCWSDCGYGGCDCDHCGSCSSGECCGNCRCYGSNVEMKGMGHEGHSHEGHEGHSH